ncbi:MAG: hypothetical protein RLN90_05805 [Balneolaceae bacterium]
MRNYKLLTIWLLAGITILSCELPKKPDFTTSHTVEAPLLINKEFQFLGGGGSVEVLIDTTKTEFDSLFILDSVTGLIKVSKEEDFDFGDLNDAIPEISTDPTTFNSQVGELEIGSFSSGETNLGTASFQDLTGLNPALVPAGTAIPGGSTPSPVNIDVGASADFFVSATVKRGAIELSITNNLGFDINEITVNLNSGATFVRSTTIADADHGTTSSGQIQFIECDGTDINLCDRLFDLNVDVSVNWLAQSTSANPGELIVENINGVGLAATQVRAAVESQDFSTSNTTAFDATEFIFSEPTHFVQLESGMLNIDPIVNDLDLTIDSLIISFPTILRGPNYLPGDSLRIRYIPGFDQILRSATSEAKERDLSGFRLYALNNEITYNIYSITENTKLAPVGDRIRTINESQEISSGVQIENLKIASAFGEILPQTVSLGEDDPSNGTNTWDLNNDSEAEITEIDGLEDISSQIDGLEFTQATLSINYESNIGVPTTIYSAFLGTNGDGDEVFLRGKSGQNAEVQAGDPIDGILRNGVQLLPEQMIKFELEPSVSGGLETFTLTFDSTNSTVTDFLNNLPSEIRFVGKAIVNESGSEATITSPLEFDPKISVDLPLAFRTTNETVFTDTTEVDALQDLPSPEDDANITEGILQISYENGLPLGFSLSLTFIDSTGAFVTSLPEDASTGAKYDLSGAIIDDVTRFAVTPTPGTIQIALTDQQLSDLYRATSIIIESNLRTTQNTEVKFRATDFIKLSVSAKISIENDF